MSAVPFVSTNRHVRLRFAAFLYFASRGLFMVLLVAGPLACQSYGITDLRIHGAALGLLVILLMAAHCVARPVRCVACSQPVLRHTKQRKHAYSGKWLGISYRARTAWDILTAKYHHCMYCHTRCRNAAHGQQGSAMPAPGQFTRSNPAMTGLGRQGPALATAFDPAEKLAPPRGAASIFDTAFLSAEPTGLPFTPGGAAPVPPAPPLPSEITELPPVTAPLSAPPPLPSSHMEAPPLPPALEPAAPPLFLPVSPFFPSVKSPQPHLSPPAAMSPVANSLPAFPFGNAVKSGPVPSMPTVAPTNASVSVPPVSSWLEERAGTPAPVIPPVSAQPSPFFPSIKPSTAPPAPAPFPAPGAETGLPLPPAVREPAPFILAVPVLPAPAPFMPPAPPVMPASPVVPPLLAPPQFMSAPVPVPAAVLPAVAAAAPVVQGLTVESVVEILQQGQKTMESAFLAMIGQLRAAVPAAPTAPAAFETREATLPPVLTPNSAPARALPVTDTIVFSAPMEMPAPAPIPRLFTAPVHELAPVAVAPLAPSAGELPPLMAACNLPAVTVALSPGPPQYPPLHPVAPPVDALPPLPALRSPWETAAPVMPSAPPAPLPPEETAASAPPVRRRALPALNPHLMAELAPTLEQAFTPAAGIPLAPSPFGLPGPVPPQPSAVPAAWNLTPAVFPPPPPTVPPGNSFAPIASPCPALGNPLPPAPAGYGPEDPLPVPAPFSFLQSVTPPPVWPLDDLADLPSADGPPMWTRTRGNSSLS